jgi:phage tail sheath gpL-like
MTTQLSKYELKLVRHAINTQLYFTRKKMTDEEHLKQAIDTLEITREELLAEMSEKLDNYSVLYKKIENTINEGGQ